MNIRVEPLSRHPSLVPVFASDYERAWPAWYGTGGPGDATAALQAAAGDKELPVGLVARFGTRPAGIVILGNDSAVGAHLPGPWVTSLYVRPEARGRGVAMRLIAAAECKAASLGCREVYIGVTDLEAAVLKRGYRLLEREIHDGAAVAILGKALH